MSHARILIVDDERGIRATLGAILSDEGYRPLAVGSGQEALARVGEDAVRVRRRRQHVVEARHDRAHQPLGPHQRLPRHAAVRG